MESQSVEGAAKLVAEVLLVNPLVQFRTIYIYNLLDCLYVCIMYTHSEHNYMYIHMHHVHPHLDILDTWAIIGYKHILSWKHVQVPLKIFLQMHPPMLFDWTRITP